MKNVLTFIVIFSSGFLAFGQGDEDESIAILSSVQENQIMLRWAPKSSLAWELLNKYGYSLERYTVLRDSVVLTTPEKLVLATSEELKPKPLHEWEAISYDNDYAAIVAQAVYGETFEVDANDQGNIMQIVNKVKERDARYSYAIFAADQSFEVAQMSGLAFVDVLAKRNEKYLYRVHSNVPVDIEPIDFGFVYASIADYKPLPKPYGLEAEFGDKSVILRWERANFDHIYNSYWVEKSVDSGLTYSRITNRPLINTSPNENNRYMFKTDSLTENAKVYHYRVRGITAFGEVSIPSDSVLGNGVQKIEYVPAITKAEIIDNQKVKVKWNFPFEAETQIDGFKIERSRNINGPYQQIKTVSSNVKEGVDDQPLSTNYYRVKAFNNTGDEKTSFAKLAQLQDSIPPIAPTDIVGRVDSLGQVTLTWQPNVEEDLLGYRVFRSNFKSAEFGQITKEPVTEPYYQDSITLKTLTGNIYYKIVAIDQRFNPSKFSNIVLVKKPDIIPPVPPVFKSIKSVDEGIAIEWVLSSSEDVAMHLVYKNKTGSSDWNLLKTISSDTLKGLIDKEVESGVYYNYTMVAVDSSELQSLPSNAVRGIKVDNGIREQIENAKAVVDRTNKSITVKWEYNQPKVKEYLIYKKQEEEALSLYTAISSEEIEFVDTNLIVNTSYLYRIKAIYEDGSESPFSKEIKVKY